MAVVAKRKTARRSGKEPSKVFTFSLPPSLVVRLDKVADREKRSRSNLVEVAMTDWLDRYNAKVA
jgi:predicted transcriptional regulator